MSVPKIDTANHYLVGRRGDQLVVLLPVVGEISKDHALVMAAWLVALADDSEGYAQFHRVLDAVLQDEGKAACTQ